MKADLEDSSHWDQLPPVEPDQVRVLSVFGNSLSGMGLKAFLRRAGAILRKGDWLLFDGELFTGEQILSSYHHPVNRRFALAPLRSVGITESDGELQFSLHPPRAGSAVGRIKKSFLFRQDTAVRIAGELLRFRRGERITMSPSDKYDRQPLLRFLADEGSFSVEDQILTPDRGFALWLCRRR
jgi:hypothetical protein